MHCLARAVIQPFMSQTWGFKLKGQSLNSLVFFADFYTLMHRLARVVSQPFMSQIWGLKGQYFLFVLILIRSLFYEELAFYGSVLGF